MDPLELVGTTVAEKYAVESVVGEGGFAVVYRALHMIWKRPVAIKVFRALDDVPPDHRARLLDQFVQEGALLADLSEKSAAICQARDVGLLTTKKGTELPFMVLEWLEGATLEAVLLDERTRGLPLRTLVDAARLLEPAAHALALAHTRGIAHRDVKPANIFVLGNPRAPDATVKILDFGIAKVVQDAQKMAGSFTKTAGKLTSFTPAYGAPEQFSRSYGATGPWTDVFALALILGEIVTGKEPLDGENLSQLAFSSIDVNRRPTPRTFGANVSDATEQVFLRALAVKPAERFATVGDFWVALRESLAMGPSAMMATLPPAVRVSTTTTGDPLSNPDLDPARAATIMATPGAAPIATAANAASVPPTPTTSTGNGGVVAPAAPARSLNLALLVGVPALVTVAAFGVLAVIYLNATRRASASSPTASASAAASASSAAVVTSAAPTGSAAAPAGACPADMVFVPGGRFFMGNDGPRAFENEKPVHQVQLSPYCIDRLEVTTEQYKACSDRGDCRRASSTNDWRGIKAKERAVYDPLCNVRAPEDRGKHPINCVDWQRAADYCKATKRRLPTEAEWEFAARSPDGRTYPWGDEEPLGGHGHLNACGPECVAWQKKNGVAAADAKPMYDQDDGFVTTAPAGSFPAGKTAYGALDMVGNVWEWTLDNWGDYAATKSGEPQVDPVGPQSGERRVIRGGAFNSTDPSWARPSFRFAADPDMKSYGIGFRCALPLSHTP